MARGYIKGITIEFEGNTTKLDRALRQIDSETKKLNTSLKAVERGLKFNPGSVELWRQKQTLLNQKLDEANQRAKVLRQTLNDFEAGKIQLTEQEVDELKRELIEAERQAKQCKAELMKIGEVKLHAVGEQLNQIGSQLTQIGKDATYKLTAPLVLAGAKAVKSYAEVDKTMQLTNSTMGNTTEQAQLLDKAMKDAAANSTFGMSDAATATLNFARAGLTAEQAASALAPAMNLAAGEGGDLDTVSAGLVATINGFHGSFEQAAEYADVFTNACNNSALDINGLSQAMSVAAPIFSAAGYGVRDAALYMGTMANAGIESSVAANSLKTGLARLVSPSKEASGWLEKLGIEVTNVDGSMKDSVTVQKELHDAFAGLSESEQIAAASAIFGKNQMSNWLALINTAPGEVAKLNDQLGETKTASKMAAAMMEGFGGKLENLKSSLDVAAVSLGQALAPAIGWVADKIQGLVDWFNNLDPKMQSVIATIGLVVAAIGPVLLILGALASGIGSIISVIGILIPLLSGPLLPIIAIIAAITALIILFPKIKEVALQVVEGVKAAWENLKASITEKINALKASLINTWNSIKSVTQNAWNSIKNAIIRPFEDAKNFINNVINTVRSWFPIEIGDFFGHIDLPHFTLEGEFSLDPPSVPSLHIDWYKNGAIFTKPTIFGDKGVGDDGAEAVLPLKRLWQEMDKRFATAGSGGNNFYIYAQPGQDAKEIAREVEKILVQKEKQRKAAFT